MKILKACLSYKNCHILSFPPSFFYPNFHFNSYKTPPLLPSNTLATIVATQSRSSHHVRVPISRIVSMIIGAPLFQFRAKHRGKDRGSRLTKQGRERAVCKTWSGGWWVRVIQILLSARDNGRYTSIRQCRTIAEREAARNRAVSLTTCNGTAVSIGWFAREERVHAPPLPSPHFSRVFLTKRNAAKDGWRKRERGMREREGESGKVKPWRTGDTKTERETGTHVAIRENERMRARPMDATCTIPRIVHAPLKTTKQCVEARFCPVTSRPFRSRPQPEKERCTNRTYVYIHT